MTAIGPDASKVPPHAPLLVYYGTERERRAFLTAVFDRTAVHYDRIDRAMSLGSGALYRRLALRRAGLAAGMRHLDVAVGTGAVARSGVAIVGGRGKVLGLDPSFGMLRQAAGRPGLPVAGGLAERLPFADRRFDFLSMGYALRHVADLLETFREYFRVLRPGGRLLVLEFARPATRLGYLLGRSYFHRLVPAVSRLVAGDREARLLMRYCWDTIDACVPGEAIRSALAAAGFERVEQETYLGVFREYRARRPA